MNPRIPTDPELPASLLVGVDESGLSDHAVRRALDLGERLQARVELVHAVPTPPSYWPGIDPVYGEKMNAELVTRAREIVAVRLEHLLGASRTAGVEASRARVLEGHPAKVLLTQARELAADWIVLGAHRSRGGVDFGGTLRAIFARSPLSVWVETRPVREIRTILAPIDRSEESLRALAVASSLTRALDARMRVVECSQLGGAYFAAGIDLTGLASTLPVESLRKAERASFERAMAEIDWKGCEHTAEFVSAEPVEEIITRSRDADLIVLGTHGRTGLSSVLLGGVAYGVLRRSEVPVLAVRRPGRAFLL